jgi:hypothetical protein
LRSVETLVRRVATPVRSFFCLSVGISFVRAKTK